MEEFGFGITLEDIKAHLEKDEIMKTKNSKKRKDGETFGSELIAGAKSFDELYGDEFYNLAVK